MCDVIREEEEKKSKEIFEKMAVTHKTKALKNI
jgi:hypothetical protein